MFDPVGKVLRRSVRTDSKDPNDARLEYTTKYSLTALGLIFLISFPLSLVGQVYGVFPANTPITIYIWFSVIVVSLFLAHRGYWRQVRVIPLILFFVVGIWDRLSFGTNPSSVFEFQLVLIFTAMLFGRKTQLKTLVIVIITNLALCPIRYYVLGEALMEFELFHLFAAIMIYIFSYAMLLFMNAQYTKTLVKVQKYAGRLKEEISERKKTEKQLRKAKKQVEKAKKQEEDFVAMVSHEIRTPMNAVLGTIYLLKDTKLSPKQSEYFDTLVQAGRNLVEITNDILDVSRIEAGAMEFKSVPFSVRDVIESVVRSIGFATKEKGLDVLSHVDPDIPDLLVGDPVRLHQILLNLADNAAKYTEEGSIEVWVSAIKDMGDSMEVQFAMKDTGVGIPQRQMANIFNTYSRGDPNKVGFGLGLTVVKKLVDAFGGEVDIESEEGVGTTVKIALSFGKISGTDVPKVSFDPSEIPDKDMDFDILLAEDNETNLLITEHILRSFGASVTSVVNGKEALEKLRKKRFDIVLLDLQMPVIDGFEAAVKIRKSHDKRVNKLPIIALSAYTSPREIRRAKEAGVDLCIPKPINPPDLYNALVRVMRS